MALQPFLKSYAILVCPDDSGSPTQNLPDFSSNVRVSYAETEMFLDFSHTGRPNGPGVTLNQVPSPALSVLLQERGRCADNPADWYFCATSFTLGPDMNDDPVPGWRHGDKNTANFLYADGHVKSTNWSKDTVHYPQFQGYAYGDSSLVYHNGQYVGQDASYAGYGSPWPQ